MIESESQYISCITKIGTYDIESLDGMLLLQGSVKAYAIDNASIDLAKLQGNLVMNAIMFRTMANQKSSDGIVTSSGGNSAFFYGFNSITSSTQVTSYSQLFIGHSTYLMKAAQT